MIGTSACAHLALAGAGIGHPQRSEKRWKESVRGLRAMMAAIAKGDASLAEILLRDEITKAAAEVMRLLINKQVATALDGSICAKSSRRSLHGH